MLLFTCPYCNKTLKVAEAHLGKRGRCNKCGGRIAIIGSAEVSTPQVASPVTDEVAGEPPAPATQRQQQYLKELGASDGRIAGLDREQASDLIDGLKAQRGGALPPTPKQLAYLERLGATREQIAGIDSQASASQLIEELHLSPTPGQMAYLRDLGATGAQLAWLKTKAQASALIQSLAAQKRRA